MEIDELFPVAETLQMLRFAEVAGGDIRLAHEGRRFADLDTDQRKQLFARHLLAYVALAAHIRRVLDERPGNRAPWSRFADELEDHMSPGAAEQTLRRSSSLAATRRFLPMMMKRTCSAWTIPEPARLRGSNGGRPA